MAYTVELCPGCMTVTNDPMAFPVHDKGCPRMEGPACDWCGHQVLYLRNGQWKCNGCGEAS